MSISLCRAARSLWTDEGGRLPRPEPAAIGASKEAHEAALTVEDYAELGVTDPVQVGNLRALISDEYDRERGLGTPD